MDLLCPKLRILPTSTGAGRDCWSVIQAEIASALQSLHKSNFITAEQTVYNKSVPQGGAKESLLSWLEIGLVPGTKYWKFTATHLGRATLFSAMTCDEVSMLLLTPFRGLFDKTMNAQ